MGIKAGIIEIWEDLLSYRTLKVTLHLLEPKTLIAKPFNPGR